MQDNSKNKTKVEIVDADASDKDGVKYIGMVGYVDSYNPYALVIINEKIVGFSLYNLKVISEAEYQTKMQEQARLNRIKDINGDNTI